MQKTSKRVLAVVLALVMALSVFSISASAYDITYQSTTHTVFKHTESTLAPGITQDIFHAYQTSDGAQNIYYVFTADINRDDVLVQGSYKDAQVSDWGMQRLTEQMAAANAKYSDPSNPEFISEYYTAIAGTNGDFYNISTGRPSGAFAINGTVANSANNRPWFAILKDGTAKIGYNNSDWPGNANVKEAVGGSHVIVWQGQDSTSGITGSYNTGREPRTSIGIKADGSIVSAVLDGRQDPVSSGGTLHELAQIMLEAGCVYAINLDGGGSSTFAARQAGSDTVEVINHPSDNSERAISSGVIIASLTPPSDVFDRAVITPEDEYITPGTSTEITVTGVSPAGSSADVPAEVTYNVTGGTFNGTEFTSNGTVGDATITAMYNGKTVGAATIHVVTPDAIGFSQSTITVPLGKTVDIGLYATYGVFDVKTKASDYTITNSIGTVDGFNITAPADASVLTGTITATLNANNSITANANLNFGKGSEVLFDFEDPTLDLEWVDLVEDNTYNISLEHYYVTEETGRVYNGNGALALHADFSQDNETRWSRVGVRNNGEDIVIPADAKTFGFWLYVPKEAVGFEIDFRPYALQANGTWKRVTLTTYENGWASTLQEDGWHYYYYDIANLNELRLPGAQGKSVLPTVNLKHEFLQLYIDLGDDNDTYNFDFSDYANAAGDFYFYIDDMSVDYSTAADDREPPVFGNFSYATQTMADASVIAKGAVPTVTDNHLDFTAKVAEDTAKSNYTGIDASSAKAYIDGVEVDAFYQNGSIATTSTATLADGVHTVKFAICDKQGNYSSSIRQINVNAGSGIDTIKVVPNFGSYDRVKLGSLCYIDLVATDISKVNSVTTQIQLNTKTKWELDHMTVADGFTAEYSLRNDNNVATITITKTGDVALTGEQTLASIPIRAWSTPYEATFKSKNSFFRTDVSFDTLYGLMESTDGDVSFSAAHQARDTEVYASYADMAAADRTKAWHTHNAQPVDNLAPSCTESGYTGRTFCDDCNSIVDWGTEVEATGHNYVVDPQDGLLKCEGCNELFSGVFTDGKFYDEGALYTGFHDSKYYIDGVLQPYTGVVKIDDKYYEFDENNVNQGVYSGVFYDQDAQGYYYAQLGELNGGWKEIEGDWYYFDPTTAKAASGSKKLGVVTFEFEENGKLTSGVWYEDGEGTMYYYGPGYYKSSNLATIQFAEIDGKTYGFDQQGYRYEGVRVAHESNANNRAYEFTDEGVYVGLSDITGIVEGKKNNYYYCVDGIVTGVGMIEIGDDIYYVNTKGVVVTGEYYCTYTNGIMPPAVYKFDIDGKMIRDDEELKNGIVDGYYYVDGKLTRAGMIQIDDDYYYIKSDCHVATGQYYCTFTNGLMPEGIYNFDEDGKMIIVQPEEPKNGIVDGYYYVDGKKTHAGLIKIDDDYYYIKSDCSVATGQYYCTFTNGLMPEGSYLFGEDGKMIIPEPEEEKNGVVDGYYYVKSDCSVATGQYYCTYTNDLMPQGSYLFDEDGKMILPEQEEEKNGVVDGYYYVNGKKTHAGMIEWEGDIYYVKSDCSVATGRYYCTYTNGLMPQGSYLFGDDGKLIQ